MAEQDNPAFYKLVNSVTGHYYVGASSTPSNRERYHLNDIRRGTKPKRWQQLWNDHPQTRNVAVWHMHIVRRYPDMEAAVRCENAFLQARVGNDPLCLNHRRTPDKVVSPSTGMEFSDSHRSNLSAAHAGKILSDAHKARIGLANSNRTCTDETKDRIRSAMKGNNNCRGRKLSPEHIRALREGRERARAKRDSGAA